MTTTTATHQVVDFGPGKDNLDVTLGYPLEGSEEECGRYADELNANCPNVRTDGKSRFCVQEIPAD